MGSHGFDQIEFCGNAHGLIGGNHDAATGNNEPRRARAFCVCTAGYDGVKFFVGRVEYRRVCINSVKA